MITPEEALDLVVEAAVPRAGRMCTLGAVGGLVLAENIVANQDYPPFPRAMMDGFAVRLADAGKTVPVAGEIPAGTTWDGELAAGRCLAIMTGAPCPRGAEAVVPIEHTRQEGGAVVLPAEIAPGENIAPPGSDCCPGQRVLAAGDLLTPMAIGILASFDRGVVRAIPRPRLAILTTGGELAAAGKPMAPGQIRNSNGPMLSAMAEELGLEPPRRLHAPDRLTEIRAALEQLAEAEIVVLTGGVSVGTYDLVPQALAELGAETVFHGVRQKPGKPILFARTARQLFFGLPGNPLASHFGFHRYVSAAVGGLSGQGAPRPLEGVLAAPVEAKKGRTHFVPGRAELTSDASRAWRVAPLPGASSADIFHAAAADCYLEVPPGRALAAGDLCRFTRL